MLQQKSVSPVPEETARVARAAFPKGNLYMTMRSEIGTLYSDQDFEALFPTHGQPAQCPWRLALICVMQFMEELSDRQAFLLHYAVGGKWKYALGLELTEERLRFFCTVRVPSTANCWGQRATVIGYAFKAI